MGRSQYIGFLLWTMVLCAQRPPNELFPLTPLNQEQQMVLDKLSNRSVSTLSETETFTLANIYLQDRRYSEALSFYDELCERNPNRFLYQFGRGASAGFLLSGTPSLRSLRYIVQLRSSFEAAVRLQPNSLVARRVLLNIYLGLPRLLGGSQIKAEQQLKAIQSINPLEGALAGAIYAMNNKDQSAFAQQAQMAYNDSKHQFAVNDSRYELAMITSYFFGDFERAIQLLNDFLDNANLGDQYPPIFARYRLAELNNDNPQLLNLMKEEVAELDTFLVTYDPLSTYIRNIKPN
ncbi:MAG: tetratricopeptide repeat protein [Flavobacteriaceae bacterium]